MKQGELFTTAIPQTNNNPKSAILLNWLISQTEKKKVVIVSHEVK